MTEQPKRYRGQRGPNKVKRESMVAVSIRLPKHVVDHYEGSSVRMRNALIDCMPPQA